MWRFLLPGTSCHPYGSNLAVVVPWLSPDGVNTRQ